MSKQLPKVFDTKPFRDAVNGDGELAAQWKDKPHRLVYDLCKQIEEMHEEAQAMREVVKAFDAYMNALAEPFSMDSMDQIATARNAYEAARANVKIGEEQ